MFNDLFTCGVLGPHSSLCTRGTPRPQAALTSNIHVSVRYTSKQKVSQSNVLLVSCHTVFKAMMYVCVLR